MPAAMPLMTLIHYVFSFSMCMLIAFLPTLLLKKFSLYCFRFTEVFVDELDESGDLRTLVVDYLSGLSPVAAVVDGIVR